MGFPMTTLIDAHDRFAAALDELRRNYLTEFELWAKSALDRTPDASREAADWIASARKRFSDEFLDQRAPAIIRTLNRNAEFDILRELRSYDAKSEPARRATAPQRHWMPSLWRTVLAAAFGAVAGVILLTMQPIGEVPKAPPPVTEPVRPRPTPPGTENPTPQLPALPTPAQVTPAPQPQPVITREAMILQLLLAAFVAALGAAIGVFIVASPPLRVLMERFGLKGPTLQLARNLGGTLLLFRIGSFIALAAALLTGFFALIAWLLGGSKPLHVAIGIAALATVFAARWTGPDATTSDRESLRRELIARLDGQLRADSDIWAALAAALVLDRGGAAALPQPGVKDVVNVILARRALHESGEDILQVVEQQLGLPSGPVPAGARQKSDGASEFVWKPEHAQTYSTFGIVEVGDVVTVSTAPLYIADAGGAKRVSQKGVVIRKRRGA